MVTEIIDQLQYLRPRQILRVEKLIQALTRGTETTLCPDSDFATEDFSNTFGDLLIEHHLASAIPLTKDKFEYAIVEALREIGLDAVKAPTGNPGEDIIVDGIPWSLKTQADRNIKRDRIHISKFMELGKGQWENTSDLIALRQRMFNHMEKYDRIFSLRCFRDYQKLKQGEEILYEYELIEIPKSLLLMSADFSIDFQEKSRQTPKPAYCTVTQSGEQLFQLYFDGGTERKLQVKNILVSRCIRHASWKLQGTADI